jgi:diguanylate cyclase (GGDEF)-like protein
MSSLDAERASLEAQVKALKDLIDVARAVVSTLDLDTVLQAILTSAMRFAEMPAGSIALYDPEKRELMFHAHAGLTAGFIKTERWKVTEGGLTEQVLKTKETIYIEDTAVSSLKNPLLEREGIRAFICIPLSLHRKIVGILHLDDFTPRVFDRDKLELLSILASFAAMAIDNAKLHNHTKLMAITDALTGLNNRRYFQHIYTQEMRRARRYKKFLSLVMIDVDDFKKFNDTYGHLNGDRVLEKLGQIISRMLRNVDYAFRYGGEEFLAVLPETNLDNALQVAERLRASIEQETISLIGGNATGGVTVSIGVACFPRDADNQESLLAFVDSLLYRAKEGGKNRVYYRESDTAYLF